MRPAAALLALSVVAAGCSGGDERVSPPPPPTTAPAPPPAPQPYRGELPGKQIDVGVDAGYVGVRRDSVHELLHVGAATTRVGLLVAVDRGDRTLCVGYRQTPAPRSQNLDFLCADEPLIVFAGREGAEPERVDRLSLVGAARDDIAFVELEYPGGRKHRVRLQHRRDFPLAAFALEAQPAPFPERAVARDVDGAVVATIPLEAAHSAPCAQPGACIGVAGAWADAVDPRSLP